LSAFSVLPSVTLAVNKHLGFNIIGVSAEIIPNGKEGIATNGIISDIALTGYSWSISLCFGYGSWFY
jgi:hypothetical protein